MPLATEIFYLLVKDGLNLEETGSAAALQWKKGATTISQQKGFVRLYWGLQIENPRIFVGTVDWDDVQDHKNFINSEAYKPFIAVLAEVFDFVASPPLICKTSINAMGPSDEADHVNLTSDSIAAREAPVTEFAPFSLPITTTSEEKSSFEDKLLALAVHCTKNAKCLNYAVGWVLEEIDNPNAADGKTILMQGILGWPTVETHMAARETSEFKEIVGPIRSAIIPPAPGRGMFHVKLHGKPKV